MRKKEPDDEEGTPLDGLVQPLVQDSVRASIRASATPTPIPPVQAPLPIHTPTPFPSGYSGMGGGGAFAFPGHGGGAFSFPSLSYVPGGDPGIPSQGYAFGSVFPAHSQSQPIPAVLQSSPSLATPALSSGGHRVDSRGFGAYVDPSSSIDGDDEDGDDDGRDEVDEGVKDEADDRNQDQYYPDSQPQLQPPQQWGFQGSSDFGIQAPMDVESGIRGGDGGGGRSLHSKVFSSPAAGDDFYSDHEGGGAPHSGPHRFDGPGVRGFVPADASGVDTMAKPELLTWLRSCAGEDAARRFEPLDVSGANFVAMPDHELHARGMTVGEVTKVRQALKQSLR